MRHLDQLNDIGGVTVAGKTLLERATGKFYTPEWLAELLADAVWQDSTPVAQNLAIVDPFAGDGRLLVRFLRHVSRNPRCRQIRWFVSAWDTDTAALARAKATLVETGQVLGLELQLDVRRQNSFAEMQRDVGRYDFVLTNPPWETLKPDARELRELSPATRATYVENLRGYDSELAARLPHSQPKFKFAGWGTNLARCGLELALELTKTGGVCGIVLPAALFGDQISAPLRRWAFGRSTLVRVDHFPAEARVFDGVDQSCGVAVLRHSKPSGFRPLVVRYDRDRRVVEENHFNLTAGELEQLDFALPLELGAREVRLLLKLNTLPTLEEDSQLWLGRELDETGYRRFVASDGRHPFVKGRMVSRFSQVVAAGEFVRETERAIPARARRARVGWRDVSRRSQARRMIATLIPAGFVTGNSLNVACFDDDDPGRLLALLGIVNSVPFEFQLRARLGTGHVSLGVMRRIHVPPMNDARLIAELAGLVAQRLAGRLGAEQQIDVAVADACGLGRADLAAMQSQIR